MKLVLLAIIIGFLADCVLGDPRSIPHPICLIGKLISKTEKLLRRVFPKTEKGELAAGGVLVVIVVALSAAVPFAILWVANKISVWLWFAVCCVMCWQILAAKCLADEAKKVRLALENEGIGAARNQVGMLVGRDTAELSETAVIKATVETVAENTGDGVIAPLFWMVIGGPVLGFAYKAINTMDSMVGYKNDKYLYFGRCAAKLDDVVNYIPARLTALGMMAVASLLGFDSKNALRIWKRDKRKHASVNSAQTESTCAGALHIELAGNAYYFGKLYEKPFIGDSDRPIEREDIDRSCRLMYGVSVFLLVVFTAAAFGISFLF